MLIAAELGYIDRPRPAPMLLEHDIDQQARSERHGYRQKYNGAA